MYTVHICDCYAGTHNILNVTATSPLSGKIRVRGDYHNVDGSKGNGVLFVIYSLTNESDIHYIVKQADQIISVSLTLFVLLTPLFIKYIVHDYLQTEYDRCNRGWFIRA